MENQMKSLRNLKRPKQKLIIFRRGSHRKQKLKGKHVINKTDVA